MTNLIFPLLLPLDEEELGLHGTQGVCESGEGGGRKKTTQPGGGKEIFWGSIADREGH